MGTVTLSCRARTDGVRFDVGDTAPGIPHDELHDIFEPYVQLATPLSIVSAARASAWRSAASSRSAMKGELSVASTVGSGSVFSLRLPAAVTIAARPLRHRATAATTATHPARSRLRRRRMSTLEHPTRRRSPCTVLVVDDDDDSRRADRLVLEHFGFVVREASRGLDALALAQASRPRVVLLDMVLPEIDGAQLARMLRADPATRHAALVAISAPTRPRFARAPSMRAATNSSANRSHRPIW